MTEDALREGDRISLKGSYMTGRVTRVERIACRDPDKEEACYFVTWDPNCLVDPRPYPREMLLAIREASS